MLAPDDQLFRISLCLIGGLWVVFLARSLSIMLMLFAQLSLSGDRSSAVRNTFAQILSFGQLCTYFVFTILSSLASALLWALPFLVLVFGINLFYENYSEGLVAAIRGYNEFFVTSEVYRSFDVMAKYGRFGFEMVVPAFNFLVAALRLIPLETLRLSLQEPAQASITGMIAALGALITDGAQGIGEMLARERTLCQVGVVQGSARREAHLCLDFEYRALDLRAANGKLGEAVGHAIQLTGCCARLRPESPPWCSTHWWTLISRRCSSTSSMPRGRSCTASGASRSCGVPCRTSLRHSACPTWAPSLCLRSAPSRASPKSSIAGLTLSLSKSCRCLSSASPANRARVRRPARY